jgi:hypothetical protein
MKLSTRALLALFTLPLFLFAMGCGENAPSDAENGNPADDQAGDLNAEFGGYTASDESPAFGDAELAKLADDGEPAEDPIADEPGFTAIRDLPSTDVYFLRLAWGILEGDSSNSVTTDWSGSLSVTRGAIVAERVLRFEPEDHIVRPRTDRTSLAVVSETRPHWDGLIVTILDPEDAADPAENEITIALGPFQQTFTMSEIATVDTIFDIDAIGNQVAVTGGVVEALPCRGGFLSGIWARTDFENGNFKGRWTTRRGWNEGFLHGNWGVDNEGKRVFFGKYIAEDGRFLGLLRGTWGVGQGRGDGWFRGFWCDADGEPIGSLHAVWMHEWHGAGDGPMGQVNRPDGFFHGQWREKCEPFLEDETRNF